MVIYNRYTPGVSEFCRTADWYYKRCLYFNWRRKVFTGFSDVSEKCSI